MFTYVGICVSTLYFFCISHRLRWGPSRGTGSGVVPVLLAETAPPGLDPDCEMGGIHTAGCRE